MSSNGLIDLSHLQIRDKTARYESVAFGPEGFLTAASATHSNPEYKAAQIKIGAKRERVKLTSKLEAERVDPERDRQEDRILLGAHCIKGGRVLTKDGTYRDLTPEDGPALCREESEGGMPDWLFDRVWTFCVVPENFTDPIEAVPEVAPVVGN